MLPTRSRLEGWKPSGLRDGARAVTAAGNKVEGAVSKVHNSCTTIPELRGWSGWSRAAANQMFGRASDRAEAVSTYADAVAAALQGGAAEIGNARRVLRSKVAEIEAGDLWVTDAWVVLIKPIAMDEEKARRLRMAAFSAQEDVNQLLIALDNADERTAEAVIGAAKDHGYVPATSVTGMELSNFLRPRDEVPDPSTVAGQQQQMLVRMEDTAMTIRDTSIHRDTEGNLVRTFFMQDGSRHEFLEMDPDRGASSFHRYEERLVRHIGADGKLISESYSWGDPDGTQVFGVRWADGTKLHATQTIDGQKRATVTASDGRTGEVSESSSFYSQIPTLLGGASSGLEDHLTTAMRSVDYGDPYVRAAGLPALSIDTADDLRAGAKFAGPALTVGAAVYDVAVGESSVCQAGISAAFGYVGGEALGTFGGVVGGASSLGWGAPAGVAVGSVLGTMGGSWVGDLVAEKVCP